MGKRTFVRVYYLLLDMVVSKTTPNFLTHTSPDTIHHHSIVTLRSFRSEPPNWTTVLAINPNHYECPLKWICFSKKVILCFLAATETGIIIAALFQHHFIPSFAHRTSIGNRSAEKFHNYDNGVIYLSKNFRKPILARVWHQLFITSSSAAHLVKQLDAPSHQPHFICQ